MAMRTNLCSAGISMSEHAAQTMYNLCHSGWEWSSNPWVGFMEPSWSPSWVGTGGLWCKWG
eukprot:10448286-Ditylum_brightwellii.AAC.1